MRTLAPLLRRAVLLVLAASFLAPAAQAQYFRFGKNKIQYEAHRWQYVQSRHFDIYFYDGGEYLANFTARAAENAYAQVAELFQHEISERIPIVVYQSHNDFAVTNVANLPTYAEGIGGVTELFKNRIAIPFTGDYRDYRRVVHHELVHAVVNDMFYGGSIQSILQNNIQLRIPTWFNEGLAEYAAQGWDTQSDMYVREAVLEDHLAPIPYLNGYFAYRGGQSVWDYVAEQYGREKVGEILQRLRLSRSVEGSFKRATGLSLEELSERWHEALEEIYYPEVTARQRLGEVAKAVVTPDENGGAYNTSPALSPQGDRLVYISTHRGLFDVYLASAADGKTIRKLIEGQTSPEFESLKILTPGITWSPDGHRIALAVKSGRSDAIAVVDVETGETTHYRIDQVDQIATVAWSPDGGRIAFDASKDAQSDIYVLDLETRETTNYTNDLFSDHEPAWHPEGHTLIFHSDRRGRTRVGRFRDENFRMTDHGFSQYDIYSLHLDTRHAERLTFDEQWDEQSAHYDGSNPSRILFISDRNGIYNLWMRDLETGREHPLTDLSIGATQVTLAADGRRAALVSLKGGSPSIYVMKMPFEREIERDTLKPNVWAQRVMQEAPAPSPAVALAARERVQGNPFLRDATDGVGFQPVARRDAPMLASRSGLPLDIGSPATADTAATDEQRVPNDTTAYGSVRVDFRNYVFSDAFDEARREERERVGLSTRDRFDPADNVDENGDYKPRNYKLKFSPDFIYGSTGYDMLYGVQGVTQMLFSDMLGNHQLMVMTNLLVDLRTSDYYLSYNYLPRRTDWSLFGYHVARQFRDFDLLGQWHWYRYRHYGAGVSASYPFTKFRRVDVDLSLLGVSQADISDPKQEPASRALWYPTLTYTQDYTTPGMLAPVDGHRLAFSLSGSPGNLVTGRQTRFVTVLSDARSYVSLGDTRYSFAFRVSGGASFGPDPQLFYSSGVQNWINRRFSSNGYPIDDISDFLFATPVLPLRGSSINAQNGTYFGLFNAEFRFPLVAAMLPGPIPILPLYNMQGTAFVDAGSVWGGRGVAAVYDAEQDAYLSTSNRSFNVFTERDGERVFDDLLVGAGFGLRTILLGYPLRLDFAWPYDGQHFGERQTYISIGLDF